jgi:two-component system, chemotaxis family, CheB/CheR fusion protein
MLRVLVVDDSPDTAESLALLLWAWGHEAITASDAPSALEEAARHSPEAALVDIGLPGMDGFELARRLRQLRGMAGALLVALTGLATEPDRQRALEAGFNLHVAKPADPDELRLLLLRHERVSRGASGASVS